MARRRGVAVALDALDRIYLRRALELAERGRGGTSPNPCVGAVVARGSVTLGEGFHHRKGSPHAEVEALAGARARGNDPRGSTLYVSLEPCAHAGAVGPCTEAVIEAGVARVVVGTLDPSARVNGRGAGALRAAGIAVEVAADPAARAAIEDFSVANGRERPYLRLKMAASLDGFVAAQPGSVRLTAERARDFVRDLRAACDAVMVGAGTVRIDDPQLTVRPPRTRARPYLRVVVCEEKPVAPDARVFAETPGYRRTIVLAPRGARSEFAALERVAEVVYAGGEWARCLDLAAGLAALRERDVHSVLCEGGPTLAASLLAAGLVDRLDWLIAPALLSSEGAVGVLASARGVGAAGPFVFDRVERLGPDVLLSARLGAGSAPAA